MAAVPALLTVERFRQFPKEGGTYLHELHHGEVVRVTRPRAKHHKLQIRLERLLRPLAQGFGEVAMEVPYRPVAEFDLRAADVAVVSRARWEQIDPDDNLRGAPEIVIEVRSPSNTQAELRELASLCLANGGFEFWIADPDARSIVVLRRDGTSSSYGSGQRIPLPLFGSEWLEVSDLFPA